MQLISFMSVLILMIVKFDVAMVHLMQIMYMSYNFNIPQGPKKFKTFENTYKCCNPK